MSTPSEYQAFVQHFSGHGVSTVVNLQHAITTLHHPTPVTVTQDHHFNLARFAEDQGHADLGSLTKIDSTESLSQLSYVAPKRRREGQGRVEEMSSFASYKVVWKGEELKAIIAMFFHPNRGPVTQWHVVGPSDLAKSLIQECCAWSAITKKAILVYDHGHWHPDTALWRGVQASSWDDIILDGSLKSAIRRDYTSFFKSEAMYKSLQVPWKRGLILMGVSMYADPSLSPGNGKTLSMKAIMQDVGVPSLYVKTFSNPNGDEVSIRQIFSRARAEAPCVLVLEDLDSLVTERNRSFFLNEVDGLEDNDGILLVGTTNHFEKLDSALSSRPSRFDRKYEFLAPTDNERSAYTKYWQTKLSTNAQLSFPDELVQVVVKQTEGFSFAYLKEVFISALLTVANVHGDGDEKSDTGTTAQDFTQAVHDQIAFLRKQLTAGTEGGMASSWSKSMTADSGGGGGHPMFHFGPGGGRMMRHVQAM